MFVVNEETLKSTIDKNIASVIVPELTGKQWEKTIADLMADMLQIQIGDYLFFWETKDKSQKSRIHGVYRAISKPYYFCESTDDTAPLKIHIEKAYDFKEPIDEYDVLNCPYVKTSMWTIIGKKIANKPRGTSPLSLEETKILIDLLIEKNPNFSYCPFSEKSIIHEDNYLKLNYIFGKENKHPKSLIDFKPNELSFFKKDKNVIYEKVLETIFNQELTAKNKDFFSQIGIDVSKVIWYSNYLPYSLEKSEMDYVIIESEDNFVPSKIFVIEFMRDTIDEDHIHRTLMYSKWVSETLSYGANIVQPLLIASESIDFNAEKKNEREKMKYEKLIELIKQYEDEYKSNSLAIYTYNFDENKALFTKKK